MKSSAARSRLAISADGHGVVSHAGVGMLRELADLTGLSSQVTGALADTYRGPWTHAPGEVFADLAAAVADGADCVDGVGQLWGDRSHVFGQVASTTTLWRLLDERIDATHLPVDLRGARLCPRAGQAAGAAPDHDGGGMWMSMPPSPSITPTTRRTPPRPGSTPSECTRCWCFWTGARSPPGKLWPGCCVPAMPAATPPPITSLCSVRRWSRCRRPTGRAPKTRMHQRFFICSDSAGATYALAAACRKSGVGFSFGTAIDTRIRDATEVLNTAAAWYPAIDVDGGIRDGAWVAEATDLVDLSAWPEGTRLILRKERPHPGAQLRFTDSDGHRVTGYITDTPDGVVPGQLAGLELRHRQHDRVEERIREAKTTGLRNLPFNSFDANKAWLEIVMTATDLVAWAKLIGFTDHPDLTGAKSTPSATGSCTSPPASPAAPDAPGWRSTPPGGGPKRSPPPGDASRGIHLDPDTPAQTRTESTTGPRKARPTGRRRATCHARPQ